MKKLLMMGLVALSLSACAASPADGDAGYQKWMQGVVEKIKEIARQIGAVFRGQKAEAEADSPSP